MVVLCLKLLLGHHQVEQQKRRLVYVPVAQG